jgi:diguanylate cyclase (GGDEF)-like protein
MRFELSSTQRALLFGESKAVRAEFVKNVSGLIVEHFGHCPKPIERARVLLDTLVKTLGEQPNQALTIDDDMMAQLIRTIVIRRRFQIAADIEQKVSLIHDENFKNQTKQVLEPYDELMGQPWFEDGRPVLLPRLADYLVMEEAERLEPAMTNFNNTQRLTDEKFHILQAPQLFIPDLDSNRVKCELRGIGCAVAFVDIDDFKAFNSAYTEPIVDMRVLPKFMRTIEGHLYARGYGYRIGGDEYLILLQNATREVSKSFFESLRAAIENLTYESIDRKTTVSMGVVFVAPGCFFTSHEIREKAAIAKAEAKRLGKNCIATFTDDHYEKLVKVDPAIRNVGSTIPAE